MNDMHATVWFQITYNDRTPYKWLNSSILSVGETVTSMYLPTTLYEQNTTQGHLFIRHLIGLVSDITFF